MLKCSLTTQQCPFHTFTVILTLSGFYLGYAWTEFSRLLCLNSERALCLNAIAVSICVDDWYINEEYKYSSWRTEEVREVLVVQHWQIQGTGMHSAVYMHPRSASRTNDLPQHLAARLMQVFPCCSLHVWINRWGEIPDLILQRSARVYVWKGLMTCTNEIMQLGLCTQTRQWTTQLVLSVTHLFSL